MALCLAESLVECCGFDIGNTVRSALGRCEQTGEPFSGPTSRHTAGNGSLMRLAPVSLYFTAELREAIENSGESSRTTHGAAAAVAACRYFTGLIVGALRGETKETLLAECYIPLPGCWAERPLDATSTSVNLGDAADTTGAVYG